MTVLSRTEEMLLLAIWRLQDNAYGVTIADMMTRTSEKKWTLGGIYVPLERLEKKGYLSSTLGKSSPRRGGRSKRLYRVTEFGRRSLIRTEALQRSIWKDISISSLERGYEKRKS